MLLQYAIMTHPKIMQITLAYEHIHKNMHGRMELNYLNITNIHVYLSINYRFHQMVLYKLL